MAKTESKTSFICVGRDGNASSAMPTLADAYEDMLCTYGLSVDDEPAENCSYYEVRVIKRVVVTRDIQEG